MDILSVTEGKNSSHLVQGDVSGPGRSEHGQNPDSVGILF